MLRAGALVLASASACSLSFNFEVEQCKFNRDCGPIASGLTCAEGLCVAVPPCERNTDCAGDGQAKVCAASTKQCQPLIGTSGCFARFPAEGPVQDGAIVLGAIAARPRTAEDDTAPQTGRVLDNYELAIAELNARGGLPPGERQVVLVVCDNGASAKDEQEQVTMVAESLDHLVQALEVPAVVAGFSGAQALRIAWSTLPDGPRPLFLSPYASDGIELPEDGGLIWHLANRNLDGAAMAAVANELGPTLPRDPSTERARVIILRGRETMAHELWKRLEPPLRKSYPDAVAFDAKASIGQLVDSRPDLVIVLEASGLVDSLASFGDAWERKWPTRQLPVWVLPPDTVGHRDLIEFIEGSSTWTTQDFVGVGLERGNDAVVAAYAERFSAHFSDDAPIYAWSHYDAVYYLAYAAFAASPKGAKGLEGYELRVGFKKLWDGLTVEIGPDGNETALRELADGHSIRLVGTLDARDFDEATSMPAETGLSIFCLKETDGGIEYDYDLWPYDEQLERFERDRTRRPCQTSLAP